MLNKFLNDELSESEVLRENQLQLCLVSALNNEQMRSKSIHLRIDELALFVVVFDTVHSTTSSAFESLSEAVKKYNEYII